MAASDRSFSQPGRRQSPPSPEIYQLDDNDSKEDTPFEQWIHDGSLHSVGRQVRNSIKLALEKTHVLWVSSGWGRKIQESSFFDHRQYSRRGCMSIGAAVVVLFLLLYMYMLEDEPRHHSTKLPLVGGGSHFKKPKDVKIYGIVFYGRHVTVEILDCYLRRNLVKNGGWLDAVHFIINTDDQDDLGWVEKTVKKVTGYRVIQMENGTDPRDYEKVWKQAVEPGHLYVKFDDDLVWMSDTAVEESVTTLINHPEAFLVLGNLVNSAALGWVHHHQGAIHSYLPELSPPNPPESSSYGPKAWRASALPKYHPTDGSSEPEPFPNTEKNFAGSRAAIGDVGGPPYANHRWLPLRDSGTLLPITPIWRTEYNPNGADWKGWQLGAQQHYSLLENLENDDLSAYHFGNKDGIWNMRYMHANINLMAVWADDILDNLPFDVDEDDEAHFSIHLPEKLRRQTYIQTRAMAAHFSFGPQRELYDTDLLSRYRAYANEKICGKRHQIAIPAEKGGGRTD